MEYRIEQPAYVPAHVHAPPISGKIGWIIRQRIGAGHPWTILISGVAIWDTRENAEAYLLSRFIGEKNAACARAALGVSE